jgi:hypothetical protein
MKARATLFGSVLLGLTLLLPLAAQRERDFLTADEADQVRLAQDPNARLKLYLHFCRQRLDLLQKMFASQKPGRSALIHDTLDDYSQIIEAIDIVSDDALKRQVFVDDGISAVASTEREMLKALNKFAATQAKDYSRYEFALKQAIDTTQDSLDLAQEDLYTRSTRVQEKAEEQKKEIEAQMQPKDKEEKAAEEQKAPTTDQKKRKPPTLLQPGEQIDK